MTTLEPGAAPLVAVISVFPLDMGLLVARRLSDLTALRLGVPAFGVYMPLLGAAMGTGGHWLSARRWGRDARGCARGASTSYIAGPVVVRAALPQASPEISPTLVLGIAFPFDLVAGIPPYYGAARALMPAAVGKANAIERPPPPMAGDQNESSLRGAKRSEAPSHDRP